MNLIDVEAEVWACDSDNTIYTCAVSLEIACVEKLIDLIAREYGISREEAVNLRNELRRRYNARSTIVALHREGNFDIERVINEAYLSLPLHEFGVVRSEPVFRLLADVTGEKVVFTNGPARFARAILEFLGSTELFDRIIGIQEMNFFEKPDHAAFDVFQPYLTEGKRVVLIDDDADNITAAEELGIVGILWDQQSQELRRVT